jgi:hypothetical protein
VSATCAALCASGAARGCYKCIGGCQSREELPTSHHHHHLVRGVAAWAMGGRGGTARGSHDDDGLGGHDPGRSSRGSHASLAAITTRAQMTCVGRGPWAAGGRRIAAYLCTSVRFGFIWLVEHQHTHTVTHTHTHRHNKRKTSTTGTKTSAAQVAQQTQLQSAPVMDYHSGDVSTRWHSVGP